MTPSRIPCNSLTSEPLDETFSISAANSLFRKLKKWKTENQLASKNIHKYVTNPLNAYLMIKRLTLDYKLLNERFINDAERFESRMRDIVAVNDEDRLEAVNGLLTLQQFYKLKTFDISKGIIEDRQTRKRLTAHDLYILGLEGMQRENQIFFSREFLRLAYIRVDKGRDDYGEVDEENLITTLDYLESIKVPNPYHEFDENQHLTDQNLQMLTEKVCREELFQSSFEKKDLRCRIVSNSPFLRNAPFKVEEANLVPKIWIIHDMISDGEIDVLKNAFRDDFQKVLQTISQNIKVSFVHFFS